MGTLKAIRAWSNTLQVQKTMTVNLEYQGKTIIVEGEIKTLHVLYDFKTQYSMMMITTTTATTNNY